MKGNTITSKGQLVIAGEREGLLKSEVAPRLECALGPASWGSSPGLKIKYALAAMQLKQQFEINIWSH